MNERITKRTTTNLPLKLIEEATSITGKNITETIIEGLERIKRSSAYSKAQQLRGKITFDIDLKVSRERSRS